MGDGGGDKGLIVVRSWRLGGLIHVAGALEDVVGARSISPLLEPPGNCPVVFEGIVEVHPDLRLYQPVMDLLLGMVPLGPVPAQLLVSLLEVLFVEGHLPQAVDVSFHPDVIQVLQLCVDQSA